MGEICTERGTHPFYAGYTLDVTSAIVQVIKKQLRILFWFLLYRCVAITNIYYDRPTLQCFFIDLLFCKLQDVFMTTCFGHRVTIIRSTRAIMYMIALVDLMMVIR